MHALVAFIAAFLTSHWLAPEVPNWFVLAFLAFALWERWLGATKRIVPNSTIDLVAKLARAALGLSPWTAIVARELPVLPPSVVAVVAPPPKVVVSPSLASGLPSSATFPAPRVPGRVVDADVTPTDPAPRQSAVPRNGQQGCAPVGALVALALGAALLLAGCDAVLVAPAMKAGAFAACVVAVVLYLRAIRPAALLALVAACAVGASACGGSLVDNSARVIIGAADTVHGGDRQITQYAIVHQAAIVAKAQAQHDRAGGEKELADFTHARDMARAALALARVSVEEAGVVVEEVRLGVKPQEVLADAVGKALAAASVVQRALAKLGIGGAK